MAWKMLLCKDSSGDELTIEMTFDSPESWKAWLAENYPDLLHSDRWSCDRPDYKQQGTGHRWSTLMKE